MQGQSHCSLTLRTDWQNKASLHALVIQRSLAVQLSGNLLFFIRTAIYRQSSIFVLPKQTQEADSRQTQTNKRKEVHYLQDVSSAVSMRKFRFSPGACRDNENKIISSINIMAALTSDGNITSFQKKGRNRIPYIQGTRQSVQNAQILVSSGVPSLDHVVGNGLPVGSILLIEEDTFGTFSKFILKYFLAEGVACEHPLFLASRDFLPNTFMKQLPIPIKADSTALGHDSKPDDPMTIAWRYQNMRQVQSIPGSSNSGTHLGHNFDLTQFIPSEDLESCDYTLWSAPEENDTPIGDFCNPNYGLLLSKIQKKIVEGQFRVQDEPTKQSILRLAIHSLGSPLWVNTSCDESLEDGVKKDLPKFLLYLRSLLRESYALAIVTVPSHLFRDTSIIKLCEYQSDMALRLESFAGSSYETNPVFKEYHGLLHIRKLGPVNTLATHVPESLDLAFKLRRRKFVIEKLHLPPELQESAQREQDDISTGKRAGLGCTSSPSSKLDF